ncbi:MAG: HU family DNA-binding protein [candidate division Zixibacteria bacterium]|nr:HU family DNA-binding protein [candidate division Zixibacteria bacterium]
MRKAQLAEVIAREARITRTHAEKAIESLTETITKELKKGGKITLPGFGTFSVVSRKARKGKNNPGTGEEIRIPATRTPKFKPGSTLKEEVNR